MSFTIYEASIPPMIRGLEALAKILDKAQTQAKTEDRDATSLTEARLAPDMYPFTRQIQIVSDGAKGCAARLTGQEPPSWPDTETTFPELKERVQKTIAYLKSVTPEQFAGAEDRQITLKFPNGMTMDFSGAGYVNNFVLPNFYFHMTTAYGLLRMNGIAIGKRDFLGG
jgi:hypothetical protein